MVCNSMIVYQKNAIGESNWNFNFVIYFCLLMSAAVIDIIIALVCLQYFCVKNTQLNLETIKYSMLQNIIIIIIIIYILLIIIIYYI